MVGAGWEVRFPPGPVFDTVLSSKSPIHGMWIARNRLRVSPLLASSNLLNRIGYEIRSPPRPARTKTAGLVGVVDLAGGCGCGAHRAAILAVSGKGRFLVGVLLTRPGIGG